MRGILIAAAVFAALTVAEQIGYVRGHKAGACWIIMMFPDDGRAVTHRVQARCRGVVSRRGVHL